MKLNWFNIAIHALAWVLLLVIPYISTDQVFRALDPALDIKYLLLCITVSAVLIATFYFNYLFLIPRYLLPKKYWTYFSFLLLAIATVVVLTGLIFLFSDFSPEKLTKSNPTVEKIIPVIIINAFTMWLLSIVLSIL